MDITVVPDSLEIIKMLSQESETVKEYIDTQEFVYDSSNIDAINYEGILTQCYFILISELKDKGIEFHCDDDVLFESWYETERIYHLYCWVDIAEQVKLCKNNHALIDQLENVLNNSITEMIFEDWYNVTKPYMSMDKHHGSIGRLVERFHTTEDFRNLLQYVYDQVAHEKYSFTQPIETITVYIQKMNAGRVNAESALNILMRNGFFTGLSEEDQTAIINSVKYYDMEKLSPEHISDYAWTNSVDRDDLTPEMQTVYDKLEYDHHSTTNHHIEYYLVNKDVAMDMKACILLAIGCYDKDKATMRQKSIAVMNNGGDRWTPDTKPVFIECINTLYRTITVGDES